MPLPKYVSHVFYNEPLKFFLNICFARNLKPDGKTQMMLWGLEKEKKKEENRFKEKSSWI